MSGRSSPRARRHSIAGATSSLILFVAWLAAAPSTAHTCTGDCDGGGSVTVNELIVGVGIALEARPLSACPAFDRNGDDVVEVNELVAAVAFALGSCPPATPTPEPTLPPAVMIEGQFEITPDFFGEGVVERQTVLGDCNGDGLLDALRLFWNQSPVAKLYVQTAPGTFVPQEISNAYPGSAAFADLDGDGIQDLVTSEQDVFIRRGHGDCTFDPPRRIGHGCDGYPIVQTLVTDVDLDGLTDLALSCIGSTPNQVLLARGDGDYELYSPPPAVPSSNGYPMFGIFYDDFDDDGARDLLMMIDADGSWFAWGTAADRPQFVTDDVLTRELAPIDPMGIALLDYDRDGGVEYFVSGTAYNQLYRPVGPHRLDDVAAQARIAANEDGVSFAPYPLDVDLDGWMDLLVVRRGGYRPENEHPILPYLFVNQRDGTFRDAGPQAFDAPMLSTMMTCGDLASDGRIACVVGDARGTFLLRNRVKRAGNWVGIRLRGTVSAPDASGARIALDGEPRPLVVVAGGQSPAWGEHSRDVLLAAGDRTSASVSITWPSGFVQHVAGLAAGAYTTVTEPNVLAVSSRVVPADGATLVDVTVDLAAALAANASIERSGAGTWTGPAVIEGETVRRTLRAPSEPGAARIEVQLDGVPLRVRPRIRFEASGPASAGG